MIPIQASSVPEEVADMVSLAELNEAFLLHNIRLRYARSLIYVTEFGTFYFPKSERNDLDLCWIYFDLGESI